MKYNGFSNDEGNERPMRASKILTVLLALLWGAAALAADSYDLSAENIRVYTEYLCSEIGIRETGSPEERAAADWLESHLTDMGFSAVDDSLVRTEFQGLKEQRSENIVAICNADSEGPLFSIVAHYDSVATSPGARDNAAAVGILLEIARALGPSCPSLPCEVRMAFLGSEENGYHGARAYVDSLSEADRARHRAAFNMDICVASPGDDAQLAVNLLGGMLPDGRYVDADFLPEIQNTVSLAVAEACQELYGVPLGGVFYYGESDHVPFHDAGLEAANVCWRRIEDGAPRLPESYHRMSDVPDGLDYDTAVTAGRCILRAVEILAAEVDG